MKPGKKHTKACLRWSRSDCKALFSEFLKNPTSVAKICQKITSRSYKAVSRLYYRNLNKNSYWTFDEDLELFETIFDFFDKTLGEFDNSDQRLRGYFLKNWAMTKYKQEFGSKQPEDMEVQEDEEMKEETKKEEKENTNVKKENKVRTFVNPLFMDSEPDEVKDDDDVSFVREVKSRVNTKIRKQGVKCKLERDESMKESVKNNDSKENLNSSIRKEDKKVSKTIEKDLPKNPPQKCLKRTKTTKNPQKRPNPKTRKNPSKPQKPPKTLKPTSSNPNPPPKPRPASTLPSPPPTSFPLFPPMPPCSQSTSSTSQESINNIFKSAFTQLFTPQNFQGQGQTPGLNKNNLKE